jgi:effector protein SdcA
MVIKMVDVIKFKEPEQCEYLHIDKNNKVHILLPIVGGDEIGLDNTCETTGELLAFFMEKHTGEQNIPLNITLPNIKRIWKKI